MSLFRDEEGNERIAPSERAAAARAEWLKNNPHYKDIMREQLTRPARWTEAELDAAVERWKQSVEDWSQRHPLAFDTITRLAERHARRARRLYRLAIVLGALSALLAIAFGALLAAAG